MLAHFSMSRSIRFFFSRLQLYSTRQVCASWNIRSTNYKDIGQRIANRWFENGLDSDMKKFANRELTLSKREFTNRVDFFGTVAWFHIRLVSLKKKHVGMFFDNDRWKKITTERNSHKILLNRRIRGEYAELCGSVLRTSRSIRQPSRNNSMSRLFLHFYHFATHCVDLSFHLVCAYAQHHPLFSFCFVFQSSRYGQDNNHFSRYILINIATIHIATPIKYLMEYHEKISNFDHTFLISWKIWRQKSKDELARVKDYCKISIFFNLRLSSLMRFILASKKIPNE